MESIFIATAFALGYLARQIGLPPLVGFLIAGFGLNLAGFESGELLPRLADLGVTLLLFSIGLKLKVETLLKPEVWAGASRIWPWWCCFLVLASSPWRRPDCIFLPSPTSPPVS